MPDLVNRFSFIVHQKKQPLSAANNESRTTNNEQRITLNQRGISQILLPLFLVAAIGLTVYLVQQRTNIVPFAATLPTPPDGCVKVGLSESNRYVAFKNSNEDNIEPKKSSGPEYEQFGRDSGFDGKKGEELRAKEFKDVVYKFSADGDEWIYTIRKGKNPNDTLKEDPYKDEYLKVKDWNQYYKCENLGYDANSNSCLTENPGTASPANGKFPLATMSHFDRGTMIETSVKDPNGEKFQQRGTGNDKQSTSGYVATGYDNDRIVIYTNYVTGGSGQNDSGVPNTIGTPDAVSYNGWTPFPAILQITPSEIVAFVPKDPENQNIKCAPGSKNDSTGSLLDAGKSCGKDSQCKSGDCSGGKCVGGAKTSGSSCTKGTDCASGSCTNGKCDSTGTKTGSSSCTSGSECQSGTCTNNKCAGGTTATGRACNENKDCASNKCVNNQCAAASPSSSPSPSSSASSSPSGSASASPSGSASPAASTSPAPSASSGGGGTIPISLTKAEIIGFKSSFDALNQRLPASPSGNLRIVSTLAKNELTSIVNELPTCPDNANVGQCIDSKFRTRFDLAKTAARLSAFYAVFNDIPGICVKADLGLNPLFTATSANNTTGRVNICNDRRVPQKIWMIFAGGTFTPILSTDQKFKPNPTCATLPTDVITHYRNAETLFKNQPGFIQNTFCDGKTSVESGNDTSLTSNSTSSPSNSSLPRCYESNFTCSLSTGACNLSRIDDNLYCTIKGVFNKDFYCNKLSPDSEYSHSCPGNYPTCDSCGQCRNSSNQIYPGTPNAIDTCPIN